MMQTINGKSVYVVEFDTMPELPITGLTEEEAQVVKYNSIVDQFCLGYASMASLLGGRKSSTGDYSRALTDAIETGVITKPGKYGIHIEFNGKANWKYDIFTITE